MKRSTESINGEKKAFVKKLKFDELVSQEGPIVNLDKQLENVFPDEKVALNGSGSSNVCEDKQNICAKLSLPLPQVSATLEPIDEPNCETYKLVSIICHVSNKLGVGHYISFVFNFEHSKWFLCNDQRVEEVDISKLLEDTCKSSLCYFYVHTQD